MEEDRRTVSKFTLREWVNIFLYKTLTLTGVLLFLFDDILPVPLALLEILALYKRSRLNRPMADQIDKRISVYSEDHVPRQNVTNKFESWRYNTELPRNLIEITF